MQYALPCGGNNFRKTVSGKTIEKTIAVRKLLCYNNSILKIMEVLIMKYVCDVCGWEYDEELGYPEGGSAPGTAWADVPDDFECPLCMVGKDQFSEA